ncbi:MAG: hypothetical protein LBR21_10695 [Propionibacteriaceae bacterium]|jgi:flotillin|nr:hypothetical protein [Propionibacteriaceae bacterium]
MGSTFASNPTLLPIVSIIIVVAVLIFAIAKRYRIPEANEALIVTGSTGSNPDGSPMLTVALGRGKFIIPFIQRARMLSLEATEIQMEVPEGVSKDNIKVRVEAVALAKVDGTPEGVRAAAQRFLDRESQIPDIVRSILAGALRGVVGNMTVEEMLRDREGLAIKIQEAAGQALSDAGLRVDTLQINGITTDPVDYILNLGRPQAAKARREAEVAEAENNQAAAEAQAKARIAIAAAQKEASIQEAEFKKETDRAQAEADAVGPKTKAAQDAAITEAQQANAQRQAELTKLELDSSVRAQADAHLYAAQREADAALYKAERDAEAKAVSVTKAAEAEQARLTQEGQGKADAIQAQGLAEASAIKAKGEAEAQVKELLAAAYEKYGQQAVIDRMLAALPEMIAAAAKPIGDIDNITVLGNADAAAGIPKLGTDLMVTLPAVVKGATGMDMSQLFERWFASDGANAVQK